MDYIKCPSCNNEVQSDAFLCDHCGSPTVVSPEQVQQGSSENTQQHDPQPPKGMGIGKGCGIGCLSLVLLIVALIAVCAIGQSCEERERQARLLRDAQNALKVAETSPDPCKGFDNAEYAVYAVYKESDLNARLDRVFKSCVDASCENLSKTGPDVIPDQAQIQLASDILSRRDNAASNFRHGRKQNFTTKCLSHAKAVSRFSEAIEEVSSLRSSLSSDTDIVGAHEKILDAVRRDDATLRRVLPPDKAVELLLRCREKMHTQGGGKLKAEDYENAEILFLGALACNKALPEESGWERSRRRETERDLHRAERGRKRAERASKRAEAAEARRDERCRARGLELLRCEERCEIRSEQILDDYRSMMYYINCADRCGEMPESCQ